METARVIDIQENTEEKALVKTTETMLDVVNRLSVVDKPTYEFAGKLAKDLKDHKKKITDYFKPMVEAAFRAHKEVKAKENEAVQPIDSMDRIVRGKMADYINEQERIRRAEEDRQRRLAEEAARKERERLEAQAEKALDKGKVEKAEALLDKAEAVYVEPVTVAPAVEKTMRLDSGGTVSTKKDIEVVLPETPEDIRALCAAIGSGRVPYTAVNFSKAVLKAFAKMNNLSGRHYGCTFKEVSTTVIR